MHRFGYRERDELLREELLLLLLLRLDELLLEELLLLDETLDELLLLDELVRAVPEVPVFLLLALRDTLLLLLLFTLQQVRQYSRATLLSIWHNLKNFTTNEKSIEIYIDDSCRCYGGFVGAGLGIA